jgi:hypothetical protein
MEKNTEFEDVLSGFINYVQNARVKAFNEGVDDERERCAAIAAVYIEDDGKKGTLQAKIAARIRDQDFSK